MPTPRKDPLIIGSAIFLIILFAIMIWCVAREPVEPVVTFVATVEDCNVYKVPVSGKMVYVSICPTRSAVSWLNEDGVAEHTILEKSVDKP